jgi:phosphate transport system substrate-binding protein
MLVIVALMAACAPVTATKEDPLAGTYTAKGGGAPLDVFQALGDGFRKQHPKVRFTFEDIGSTAGMKLAATGDVDLATSSALPASDIAPSLTVVPVGSSGTAVIVGAANTVTGLTKLQIREIFAGTVGNWSAVGGEPGKIIVVIREASSALRSNFDLYFFGGKGTYTSNAIELNSGPDVVRAVTSTPGVISTVTMSASVLADTRIRGIAIDGIAPTKENVTSGRYPVIRPLFLVCNEKHAKPAVAAFLTFVRGPEGKRIIEQTSAGG